MTETSENIKNLTDEKLVELTGEAAFGSESGRKSQRAQAELTKRLMDSIKDLNKTSSKYSQILIWLTIVLGILAAIQIYLLVR